MDMSGPTQGLSNRHVAIDKEQVKSGLKYLKDNYKHIEREIEITT
jgi:hypothetical protein